MDVKSHSGFREASIREKKIRAKPLISWQSRPSFATQLHYVSFSPGSLFINKKHTPTIKNDIGKNRYLVVFGTFTAKYLKQFQEEKKFTIMSGVVGVWQKIEFGCFIFLLQENNVAPDSEGVFHIIVRSIIAEKVEK